MAKKIFLISGAIFIVVMATLFVYKFFILQDSYGISQVIQNTFHPDDSSESDGGEQEIKRLSKVIEKSIKGAKLSDDGVNVVYYNNQNFISANFDGTGKQSVGAYPFSKVEYINWHPKKNKVIIKDQGKFFMYDLDSNSMVALKDADVLIWDTYGERIVYKYYDSEQNKRVIAISEEDGSNEQIIVQDVPFVKVDLISVPKSDDICYFPTPEEKTESKLICLDVRSKESFEINTGLKGADYLWSPNGKKILVSYLAQEDNNRLSLATMNSTGGEFTGLKFFTSVRKCAWTNDSKGLFCGAITDIPDYAILPNDWADGKHYSKDAFWKLSLEDGKKQRIVDLEDVTTRLDAINFFVDEKERNVFFTDKQTGNLYRIRF